ncbi:site-specific integrase [Amylibacter sp.]|nr:site-specific integrase [Amylibacter sp.]
MPKLIKIAQEYAYLKGIEVKPVMIAIRQLIDICGDKNIEDYDRADARNFINKYENVKTTTIRRRLNSINAVFNWAAYELDLERRNPFAHLLIKGEGKDAQKRKPFSVTELKNLYGQSLSHGKLRLIIPILGETGCRLSEVLGATKKDIYPVDNSLILHVRENCSRGLKTTGSNRQVPIVSECARTAIEMLFKSCSSSQYIFPRYARDGYLNNTTASATLCKFLRAEFDGKTAHCLRHSLRDRLRDADVPLEAIDQIGGWSTVKGTGTLYGNGYTVSKLAMYMKRISL